MERFAGAVLLVVLAALALGVTIRDAKNRLLAVAGAAALFLIYAAVNEDIVTGQALFLFIMLFFLPFSFGAWMKQRLGRRGK